MLPERKGARGAFVINEDTPSGGDGQRRRKAGGPGAKWVAKTAAPLMFFGRNGSLPLACGF